MKRVLYILICSFLVLGHQALSQETNEAIEPSMDGGNVIDLLKSGTLDGWKIPSDKWSIEEGVIIGDTKGKKLGVPEWLYYTNRKFGDFEFTCELRLTGDNKRNTGIYYRVNTFIYEGFQGNKSFEAPSGLEFDAAFHIPGKTNYRGTLGDWYARPSLRIFPDKNIINKIYKEEDWNRLTMRVRENRLEYWINGIKVMDYEDNDPNASRNGLIGFQIHDGAVMKVEYRNIRVFPYEK